MNTRTPVIEIEVLIKNIRPDSHLTAIAEIRQRIRALNNQGEAKRLGTELSQALIGPHSSDNQQKENCIGNNQAVLEFTTW